MPQGEILFDRIVLTCQEREWATKPILWKTLKLENTARSENLIFLCAKFGLNAHVPVCVPKLPLSETVPSIDPVSLELGSKENVAASTCVNFFKHTADHT